MRTKILTGFAILLGLMFVNSGLNKFFDYMPMEMPQAAAAVINDFIASVWLWPMVAIAEIIGGVLFAIPKTRPLGALIILPVTVSIALFHLVWAPSTLIVGLILLAINVWAIVEERKAYALLIKN